MGVKLVWVQVPSSAYQLRISTIASSNLICGSVGIGRRARLRILWLLQSCGFKSHLPHSSRRNVKYIPFFLPQKQAPAKQCLVFIFSYISTISSAIFKVDSLCETIIIVFPSLLSLRDFNIIPSLSESRLLVGSSRSISGAS